MFTVLHEIAHASRNHQPPNEITAEEHKRQEEEANTLAFEWFNAHLDAKIARGLPLARYTKVELDRVMAEVQRAAQIAHDIWRWPPQG